MSEEDFQECDSCSSKPGSPLLCAGCVDNRNTIASLREEVAVMTARLELADRLVTKGNHLSEYAAAINWGPNDTNTPEWLDGLRDSILEIQEMYAAYRQGKPPQEEEEEG